jgi:lipoprotein
MIKEKLTQLFTAVVLLGCSVGVFFDILSGIANIGTFSIGFIIIVLLVIIFGSIILLANLFDE